jgi:hypothetical protein
MPDPYSIRQTVQGAGFRGSKVYDFGPLISDIYLLQSTSDPLNPEALNL